MPATPQKTIYLKAGEDYAVTFFVRSKKTKQPVDIQTWTFKAGIKEKASDAAEKDSFTFSAPFLDTEDDTWKVTRSITSAKIIGLGISEGFFDQFYSIDGGTTWKKMRRGAIIVEIKITDLT